MPPVQAFRSGLDPEHPCKNMDVVRCASNPNSEMAEVGGALELASQTS